MRLRLGSRTYDLATRALVMGVGGSVGDLVGEGADLVEVAEPGGPTPAPAPVPVCVAAADDAGLERALAAGADLVRLADPSAAVLARCAVAGVAVLVPAAAVERAAAAGLPADRVVSEELLVDVTGSPQPAAAAAAGIVGGARLVRAADVRAARRVCDVLAAVMEAD